MLPSTNTKKADIEVHIICYNEEQILPYTLRHYTSVVERVVVHDSFSTDRSREICREYGAEVVDFDMGDKLDDAEIKILQDTFWKQCRCDWAAIVAADELLYWPGGVRRTMYLYDLDNVPIVKPMGFEMCSPVFPTTRGQIYEEVTQGARDDKWYGKPVLFKPALIECVDFGIGGHSCKATLKTGEVVNPKTPTEPIMYMLHFKHIGPVERIARRYDLMRQRMSQNNIAKGWGNFEPGIKHATDKRNAILAKLEQVI